MKVKSLKNFLQTDYIVANYSNKYLGIGSGYVHDIIRIDKETGEISTPHDIWNKEIVKELNSLCEKIKQIDKDEMFSILNENDSIENPIEIYRYNYAECTVEKHRAKFSDTPTPMLTGFFNTKILIFVLKRKH